MNLLDKNSFHFCWIVDFPMFEIDEKTNKLQFSHNPFSMPQGEMDSLENKNPLILKHFNMILFVMELSYHLEQLEIINLKLCIKLLK